MMHTVGPVIMNTETPPLPLAYSELSFLDLCIMTFYTGGMYNTGWFKEMDPVSRTVEFQIRSISLKHPVQPLLTL